MTVGDLIKALQAYRTDLVVMVPRSDDDERWTEAKICGKHFIHGHPALLIGHKGPLPN